MASAAGIRMGKVFVEIGADASSFFRTVAGLNRRLGSIGRSLSAAGGKMAAIGAAGAAPFALAARAGARFDSALRDVAASTGATQQQLQQVRSAAMSMSQALGVGPTEAVQGMLELLKAGMPLEQVLGGAGDAAMQFAKVGQMAVADAAVVMADAMKVFGTDANTAANTISSAADASSTSISQLSIAFAQVGAVAGLANQTIQSTAAALAVMANAGVKGSDAGTSLKTMLLRLMAPADDAAKALSDIGLSTASFREADGRIKPLIDIIGTLNTALGGMDRSARDDIFRRIFGADAIRAAAILTDAGVSGFNDMTTAMGGSLTVGAKYGVMMGGLAGSSQGAMAAVERLSIAVGEALAPALGTAMRGLTGAADMLRKFVNDNQGLTVAIAASVAGVAALGSALGVLGITFVAASTGASALAAAFRPLTGAASLVFGVARNVNRLGNAGIAAGGQLASGMASAAGSMASVLAAAARMGAGLAYASRGFGKLAVDAAVSGSSVAASMAGKALAAVLQFARGGTAAVAQYSAKTTALMAVSSARVGAMSAAQVAATVSVISASVARAAEGNMRAAAIGVQALTRLGIAGTTNALIASQAVARLGSNGSNALIAMGNTGTTALTRIGTTATSTTGTALVTLGRVGTSAIAQIGTAALSTSAAVSGALARSAVSGSLAFARGAATSVSSFAGVSAAARDTVRVTVTGFQFASQAAAASGRAAASASSTALTAFGNLAATSARSAAGATTSLLASFGKLSAAAVASAAKASAVWLASLTRITASAAISGVAMGAAFIAPFAAIGVAIAAAGMVAMRFKGQIATALGGVGKLAGTAGSAIATMFNDAVAGAAVVFGDLAVTASTTFQGIYDAINAGDLAGAMDVLWAGLIAGWNRGVQAIMGPIDQFVTGVQNYFTDLGTGVFIAWDQLVTSLTTNELAAGVLGVFDNIANGVMATWDTLVANVQKAWIRLQGFISGARDTQQRIDAIDAGTRQRADQRGRDRPGVEARRRIAAQEADRIRAQADEQQRAALAAAEEVKAGRAAANAQRAEARAGATATANMGLGATVAGQAERRTDESIAQALISELTSAQTVDDLANVGQSISALLERDAIGSDTITKVQAAYNQAAQRIFSASAAGGAAAKSGGAAAPSPADIQAAAADGMRQAETVGTFSSAVGGMGFGSSLAQRQTDLLATIAKNTSKLTTPAEVQQ